MKHLVKFNSREKIHIWLDLCDFTSRLMAAGLNKEQLDKRLRRMREETVKGHQGFLARLGKIKL